MTNKRENTGMILFGLDLDDYKKFKITTINENKTMTRVLEALIREYIGNSD